MKFKIRLYLEKNRLENKYLRQIKEKVVKSFLDILFLSELKRSAPLSAYALMNLVNQKFGFQISAGTVYALLYSMERGDLLKGEVTESKRIYELTKKGIEVIDNILVSKDEIFQYTKKIF